MYRNKTMNTCIRIALYGIIDHLRMKSFSIAIGICILFTLLIRGCYHTNYVSQGVALNNTEIAWHVSKIAFHVICYGAILLSMLFSMHFLSHDRIHGTMNLYLSRAVTRTEYLLGRILGIWCISFAFQFILHGVIFYLAWENTKAIIPGYLSASVIASLNLLLCIACVGLFSLIVPEILAVCIMVGVVGISFISDTAFVALKSQLVQSMISSSTQHADASLVRILWPKITSLMMFASSTIDKTPFSSMGQVHPALNISFFSLLAIVAMLFVFSKKEID